MIVEIKIPEGYRRLLEGERVKKGDLFGCSIGNEWKDVGEDYGLTVIEYSPNDHEAEVFIRKI
jgi:hypothetical protein